MNFQDLLSPLTPHGVIEKLLDDEYADARLGALEWMDARKDASELPSLDGVAGFANDIQFVPIPSTRPWHKYVAKPVLHEDTLSDNATETPQIEQVTNEFDRDWLTRNCTEHIFAFQSQEQLLSPEQLAQNVLLILNSDVSGKCGRAYNQMIPCKILFAILLGISFVILTLDTRILIFYRNW